MRSMCFNRLSTLRERNEKSRRFDVHCTRLCARAGIRLPFWIDSHRCAAGHYIFVRICTRSSKFDAFPQKKNAVTVRGLGSAVARNSFVEAIRATWDRAPSLAGLTTGPDLWRARCGKRWRGNFESTCILHNATRRTRDNIYFTFVRRDRNGGFNFSHSRCSPQHWIWTQHIQRIVRGSLITTIGHTRLCRLYIIIEFYTYQKITKIISKTCIFCAIVTFEACRL